MAIEWPKMAFISRLNHFTSKLTNSIQNLVKVPMDSLNGSPKGLVNYPKPLVVSNNMKEHCNLLLNCAPSLFRYKSPISKKVTKSKKGALVILIMDRHSAFVELKLACKVCFLCCSASLLRWYNKGSNSGLDLLSLVTT